jgi:hypothetical protein
LAAVTAPTGLAGAGPERWASVSGTCAQATEEVDATDNGSNYEEDLHWEPLSAPERPSVMPGFGVSPTLHLNQQTCNLFLELAYSFRRTGI